MVRRPDSLAEARRAMRQALDELNSRLDDDGQPTLTKCAGRPVPYQSRQNPNHAATLCGRNTDSPCPVIDACRAFGYTEGIYADDMVYGGYVWKKGHPVVSETEFSPNPPLRRGPKPKISNGKRSLYT